jgi:hypothetical protein
MDGIHDTDLANGRRRWFESRLSGLCGRNHAVDRSWIMDVPLSYTNLIPNRSTDGDGLMDGWMDGWMTDRLIQSRFEIALFLKSRGKKSIQTPNNSAIVFDISPPPHLRCQVEDAERHWLHYSNVLLLLKEQY